jgi:4-oxalocrotonate tautomerase
MPFVVVEIWEGRTVEQKKALVEGIANAFAKINTPVDAVQVVIHDVPKSNWGLGTKLASEPK